MRFAMLGRWLAVGVLAAGLAGSCGGRDVAVEPKPARTVADTESLVTITVLGTNDIHGAVERLPAFAAFVEAIRSQRKQHGGGVVLVDAGDMFQGTLESNLGEGKAIVELMNAIGFDATAVGNHEFDFGPVGPSATPKTQDDDPRGALKARAVEAKFPFLGANIFDRDSGRRVDWKNVPATHVTTIAGVKVGIVGLATVDTPHTTIAANVVGLEFRALAETVKKEVAALRAQGATVIVVSAHAGGKCKEFYNPRDLSSCAPEQEIFELAEALPERGVDLIVAGHTHRGVAHVVNGIPIIEQFAHGKYFGRIDLSVSPTSGEVVATRIHQPQPVCRDESSAVCEPPERYEGLPLAVPKQAQSIAQRWIESAKATREENLGTTAEATMERSRSLESVMGNWVADLMLETHPKADVAITNGGGLRANIGAGPISYGELYRVLPFDNRFAVVQMTGAEIERALAANLAHDGGILSLGGMRAEAKCANGKLDVVLYRRGGKAVTDGDKLTVVTSDFLATTGREFVGSGKVELEDEPVIRDAIAAVLRKRRGTVSPGDKNLYDPARPRIKYSGERPLRCSKK